jgi:hypothetical protein
MALLTSLAKVALRVADAIKIAQAFIAAGLPKRIAISMRGAKS